MLKININKKKDRMKIQVAGTGREIMVETCFIIETIHRHMHQQNPEAAVAYKNHLLGVLLDPKSPVWQTSEAEEHHENQETH